MLRWPRRPDIPVIAVSYGYAKVPLAELKPDAIVDAFAELPLRVNQLLGT